MEASRSWRIAVIGVGHMGRRHCADLVKARNATLAGVYDVDRERARAVAAAFPGAVAADTLSGLTELELDGVVVATPPRRRDEALRFALDQQLHIFIEKPPCLGLDEAESLLRAASDKRVTVTVGLKYRHEPTLTRLLELIRGTRIDVLSTLTTNNAWRTGSRPAWTLDHYESGGALAEAGIHLLDYGHLVLGRPRLSQVRVLAEPRERTVVAAFLFDGGGFLVHRNLYDGIGTAMEVEVQGPTVRLFADPLRRSIDGRLGDAEVHESFAGAPFCQTLQLDDWLQSLDGGGPAVGDLADVLETVRLVEAAAEAAG
jgi:predicted dehydrogenase